MAYATQQRAQAGINVYEIEDSLARELQRRKVEEEARRREIEKVLSESDDIKLLKSKIKVAQVNKERTKQIAEVQIRKVNDLKHDAELEDNLLRKMLEEERIERERKEFLKSYRYDAKKVLVNQMQEKQLQAEEARVQYLQEKGQVDDIMKKIIQEDLSSYEDDQKKKKKMYQDMQDTLTMKAQQVEQQKAQERQENEKYKQFHQMKEKQQEEIKEKKKQEELIREQLFQRLKLQEEARRQAQEELENLRMELYAEEREALERQKSREEQEKKLRQKKEMQQAEHEHKLEKEQIKQEEQRLEQDFRRKMMQQFAEDERLEQMSQQKRRLREIEHKKEVERLWKEKLDLYRHEREQALEEQRRLQDREKWKEEIVRQEKQRLLNEYLADLQGFIPKGLLQNEEDAKILQATRQSNPPKQSTGYANNFRL